MTLQKRITACDNLTPTEQKLAEYILKNAYYLTDATILSLAKENYLSISSIHRFCKKIGLAGFKDLKVEMLRYAEHPSDTTVNINFPFLADDTCMTVATNLRNIYESTILDTIDYLDEKQLFSVSTILSGANMIDIYTHAHNIYPAGAFADRMLSIGKKVRCPEGFYNQRATALSADSQHISILISYSGRAFFLPSILEILRRKHSTPIFIGKAGIENEYPQIKHILAISDREDMQNRISQFSSHISLQYVLDILYCCVFKLNYSKNLRLLSENLSLLDDRKI
ncbi:MurR/RpiR family transcriptional regulator [Parablautia intestinalis]|uniref:MurR/RpiR family transcriptional regulator n=1 Tax=Parablautia intestinalis TaxID=2320100 RepID=A0A3A9ADF5_9FIRM|nr:MurR/RpiR family transcriptional regulator [Parablautia intestinalis]RKI89427.1 MurR/RpiR family transcriptional regulator [Parablautia intestinalis]